jgi:hypothetical protein
MGKRLGVTVVVALIVGSAVALGGALVLAVIDLALAGHGRPTLGRPWIDRAFVHMSRADLALCAMTLAAAAAAGRAAWTRAGPGGR